MQGYDNKIKHFIAGQMPEFVTADHPIFVAFMEAYFEWLQTNEEGRRLSPLTLLDQRDIDESMDSFVSLFREEYLKHFPAQLAFDQTTGAILDERKLMKHIRAFYKAKGTEKSYKFLFLVLFNTYSELYYPKTDIIRLSDGKWNTLFKIKTTSSNGRAIYDYSGGSLSQRDSNGILLAYANIKNIIQYTQGGYEVTEFIINSVYGTFLSNKPIQIKSDSQTKALTETIYTILTGFNILSTGEGATTVQADEWKLYRVGDRVILYPRHSYGEADGVGGIGQVSEIDYLNSPYFSQTGENDATGPVKKFRVIDGGVNYNPCEWIAKVVSLSGKGVEIEPTFGAVLNDYGFYTNDDGHPSSKKKLQDNRFYQDFSYVVKTDVSFDRWIDSIRKLIHPAGMMVFSQQYLYRATGYRVDDRNYVVSYEDPIIGHYTPYRFKTYENLRFNSQDIDLYPEGFNPNQGIVQENGTQQHDPLGQPLSADLQIGINNIWCLDADHSAEDYVEIMGVTGLSGSLEGTEELQAKHETWMGCTGSGPGCCSSANYWIVYGHPTSRGISSMPSYVCYDIEGIVVPTFNRFSCIKLNNFFHMPDTRYFHTFSPIQTKFDEIFVDEMSMVDSTYAAGGDPDDFGRISDKVIDTSSIIQQAKPRLINPIEDQIRDAF